MESDDSTLIGFRTQWSLVDMHSLKKALVDAAHLAGLSRPAQRPGPLPGEARQ